MIQLQSNEWAQSATADAAVAPDDNRAKTPQYAAHLPQDMEPVHVSLYCPPCAFAGVVANALRKIDARCRIRESAEIQAAHAGPDPALC